MSKIARIYQGINEIQKYYQGGVLQKLFFDWKHYIGTELNIEYAKECAGRNVVISGKTYQNLFTGGEWVQKHLAGDSRSDRISNTLRIAIKPNTVYKLEILKDETSNILVGVDGFTGSTYDYKTFSLGWKDGGKMSFKITDTTITHVGIIVKRKDESDISITDSDVLSLNIKILEGDYTDIDLPTSIDGIESAGEREFVKSKNLCPYLENGSIDINGEETNISGDVRSPFIHLNAGTYVTSNAGVVRATHICIYNLNKQFEENLSKVSTFSLDSTKYVRLYGASSNRDKFQLELGNTPTDYEPFYEYYPVAIRNYNYKCETDNIVLPDGTKNSIETIDGKKVHIQRVGKVILDGSNANNFKQVNNMQVFRWEYFFEIKDFISGLCDKFPIKNVESLINENKGIRLSGTSFRGIDIKFPDNAGFNINTFKTWLSENPVTVYYQVTTPIYTYLESGLYDNITIPSGNIKNEIYLENGKWYHKRNIGKIVLDGSYDEAWGTSGLTPQTETIMFQTAIIANTAISNSSLLCDIYGTLPDFSTDNIEGIRMGGTNDTRLYVRIKRSNLETEDINGFKAYLAKNPLEVYYELAEPVISELYFSDITYKLNEPLRSLPNGVYDTIEENKLVQRVGKVVLDGNEDWILQSCNVKGNGILNIFFMIQDLIIKLKEKQFIICDKYIQQKTPIADTTNEGVLVNEEKRLYLRLFTSKATTVEEAKEYIKDNPFVVYYELATPKETEITPDKIPLFLLKEGLTTLKSTNNITPQIELDCLVRDDFQNMCDNMWESGDIDLNTGVSKDRTDRIRLVNDIQVKSNTTYRIDTVSLINLTTYYANVGARYYDISKTYISGGLIGNIKSSTYTFTTPENCYYVRFIVETTDINFKIYLKEVIN